MAGDIRIFVLVQDVPHGTRRIRIPRFYSDLFVGEGCAFWYFLHDGENAVTKHVLLQ